jgi:hypothetical protein
MTVGVYGVRPPGAPRAQATTVNVGPDVAPSDAIDSADMLGAFLVAIINDDVEGAKLVWAGATPVWCATTIDVIFHHLVVADEQGRVRW